ncbi:MAG: cytochrome c [Deltaproteobacteria bacterium]|nr:cytochrome c [Deltaproteobacteria bacterium]
MKIISFVLLGFVVLAAGSVLAQAPADLAAPGTGIYEENCAPCHRSNGEGLAVKFPALHKNPLVLGDPQPALATVLNGRKGELGLMPAWKDKLDDGQIAAVVTYIRNAWTNKASGVTPAMVKEVRDK